jgi:hypothetical protein
MALAIPLANALTYPVSTADYLSPRSMLHRGDGCDDRSWMVDISQRLGRHLSMAGHSAFDSGMAWRSCSWRRTLFACIPFLQFALQYVLAHRAIEGRLTIGPGLHALDAGLLLLIAAGLAVRLTKLTA